MSKEEALKAWEQMYSEIDKDNWLFVGTINPQMVEWAIKALKGADDDKECHKPESEYYRAYCEERKEETYCEGCKFWY